MSTREDGEGQSRSVKSEGPSSGSRLLPSHWKWEPANESDNVERNPIYSKVGGSYKKRHLRKSSNAVEAVNLYETPDDYHDIYAPPPPRRVRDTAGTFPLRSPPRRISNKPKTTRPPSAVFTARDTQDFVNPFRQSSVAPSVYSVDTYHQHPLYDNAKNRAMMYRYPPPMVQVQKKPGPKCHFWIAVLTTLFCNFICGMIAVKYSMSSQFESARGDYWKSRSLAKKSVAYSFVAAVSSILIAALVITALLLLKVITVK